MILTLEKHELGKANDLHHNEFAPEKQLLSIESIGIRI